MTTRRNAATAGHEQGAYDGNPLTEVIERMRRLEVRSTKFMRHMGFNPTAEAAVPRIDRVLVDGRDLICSSPSVTVGELSSAANAARLHGTCRVFIGANYWGAITV